MRPRNAGRRDASLLCGARRESQALSFKTEGPRFTCRPPADLLARECGRPGGVRASCPSAPGCIRVLDRYLDAMWKYAGAIANGVVQVSMLNASDDRATTIFAEPPAIVSRSPAAELKDDERGMDFRCTRLPGFGSALTRCDPRSPLLTRTSAHPRYVVPMRLSLKNEHDRPLSLTTDQNTIIITQEQTLRGPGLIGKTPGCFGLWDLDMPDPCGAR